MSDDSKARSMQGFIVGALLAGTIAAGFLLSKQPEVPVAPPAPSVPPPMAAPNFAPPEPQAPAAPVGPREAADLLFNEAMTASEKNDEATLMQVLPSALAAYRSLGEIDDDGRYHLALLELAGGKMAESRATCASLLAKNPNHLLALGVSLRGAVKSRDAAAARDFGQRFLKAYEAESVRPLTEYRDHERMLPTYRAEALEALK